MTYWKSFLGEAAIVAGLAVALLSTLLAARWAMRGRNEDDDRP